MLLFIDPPTTKLNGVTKHNLSKIKWHKKRFANLLNFNKNLKFFFLWQNEKHLYSVIIRTFLWQEPGIRIEQVPNN